MKRNTKEFIFPIVAGVIMAIIVCFLTQEGDLRAMLVAIFASLTTMVFSLMIQLEKLENKIKNLSERR